MKRPMLTVGTPFLSACLAASFFPLDTVMCGFALLAVLFLAGLFFLKPGKKLPPCAILLAAMLGCLCWAGWLTRHSFDFSAAAGRSYSLSGRVKSLEESAGNRVSCILAVEANDIPGAPRQFTARLTLPGDASCPIGGRLSGRAKLLPFSRTAGFDMESYYRGLGIDAVFSTFEIPRVDAPLSRSPAELLAEANRRLCTRLDQYLPAPWAGLGKAILLGNQEDVDPGLDDVFLLAGITHIFVVSGLHVSLIGGLIFFLLKRLKLPPAVAAFLACGAVWAFVLLTGGKLPTLRAGIMMTVLLSGSFFHRPSDGLNSLFLAGVLIVLFSPEAIVSGSFQLSFTATLGAVGFASPLSGWLARRLRLYGKVGKAVANSLGLTFACNLLMLPVLLNLFGGISLVGPLANLLAVPLLLLLLILLFLLLLSPFPALSALLAQAAEGLFGLLTGWCRLLTASPFCYLGLDYSFVQVWCVLTCLLLGLVLLLKRKQLLGKLALFSLCGLACLLAFSAFYSRDVTEISSLTSLSGAWGAVVRQGGCADVILFQDDDYLCVQALRFLRSRNVHHINTLILAAENTDSAADEELLTAALPPGSLLLRPENELASYASSLLRPRNGIRLLREGHGFETGLSDCYREGGGVRLCVERGGTRVCLTDDPALAARTNCEILIFQEKISEIRRQNRAKYVILLDKPDSLAEILLAPDGRVRISRGNDG